MSRVTLRYEPEDEYHGELFMAGGAGGFSGQSSAWFNRADIDAFSASLGQYPLPDLRPTRLAGGEITGEGALKEVWAGLELRKWNSTGTLVALVELAWNRRPTDDWRRRGATFDFMTDYAALDAFRHQLDSMLGGTTTEATLVGFDS